MSIPWDVAKAVACWFWLYLRMPYTVTEGFRRNDEQHEAINRQADETQAKVDEVHECLDHRMDEVVGDVREIKGKLDGHILTAQGRAEQMGLKDVEVPPPE